VISTVCLHSTSHFSWWVLFFPFFFPFFSFKWFLQSFCIADLIASKKIQKNFCVYIIFLTSDCVDIFFCFKWSLQSFFIAHLSDFWEFLLSKLSPTTFTTYGTCSIGRPRGGRGEICGMEVVWVLAVELLVCDLPLFQLFLCVWHAIFIHATPIIYMWDMSDSYAGHDSVIRGTWVICSYVGLLLENSCFNGHRSFGIRTATK